MDCSVLHYFDIVMWWAISNTDPNRRLSEPGQSVLDITLKITSHDANNKPPAATFWDSTSCMTDADVTTSKAFSNIQNPMSDTDLPQNVWLIKEPPSTHLHYSSALGQTMKDKNQSSIYKMGCVNANCLTGMFQTRVCVLGNIYNVVSHVSLYMSARVTGNAK